MPCGSFTLRKELNQWHVCKQTLCLRVSVHQFGGEGGHRVLTAQLPQSQGAFGRRADAVGSGVNDSASKGPLPVRAPALGQAERLGCPPQLCALPVCHREPELAFLGATHKPSPGNPTALPLGNPARGAPRCLSGEPFAMGTSATAAERCSGYIRLLDKHQAPSACPLVTHKLRFPPP